MRSSIVRFVALVSVPVVVAACEGGGEGEGEGEGEEGEGEGEGEEGEGEGEEGDDLPPTCVVTIKSVAGVDVDGAVPVITVGDTVVFSFEAESDVAINSFAVSLVSQPEGSNADVGPVGDDDVQTVPDVAGAYVFGVIAIDENAVEGECTVGFDAVD